MQLKKPTPTPYVVYLWYCINVAIDEQPVEACFQDHEGSALYRDTLRALFSSAITYQ